MSNEETVTIPKKEYESLLDDSDKLTALEAAGVDNWPGWETPWTFTEPSKVNRRSRNN